MRAFLRRNSGFTVMELLVAIAIIVVLAAILFPVLASARNTARKTECLSHMHNLGRAMGLYVADHYGYFPPWCETYPSPTNPPAAAWKDRPAPSLVPPVRTWDMCLADYMEKWQEVVRCPGNPLRKNFGPGSNWELARAYALARQTQRPRVVGAVTNFYGGYASMIPNPSETVMIFEKGANLPGSWGDALGENVNQSHGTLADPASGYLDTPFHMGGKNILFVDGSVKWCLRGTGPFAWNPAGSNGAGACERWGVENKTTPASGGDWPPLS